MRLNNIISQINDLMDSRELGNIIFDIYMVFIITILNYSITTMEDRAHTVLKSINSKQSFPGIYAQAYYYYYTDEIFVLYYYRKRNRKYYEGILWVERVSNILP